MKQFYCCRFVVVAIVDVVLSIQSLVYPNIISKKKNKQSLQFYLFFLLIIYNQRTNREKEVEKITDK